MEIKKIMDRYKKHSPKEFFEWLSKGRTVEIRFLNDYQGNKFSKWGLIEELAEKFKLEYRYNSLYLHTYEEMKNILLYKYCGYPLTRLFNIFIGVNPRRQIMLKSKNGLLYKSYQGSIAGTSHIQNILCDIEHKERSGNATEAELEECIQAAKHLVSALELEDYWINISGNGAHLWFDLDEPIELPMPNYKEFEDKMKYLMKEEPIVIYIKTYNKFIEKLDGILQKYNPKLKVDDGAKDIARIARAPGSWNVKFGKTQRCVGTAVKNISNIKYNYKHFMAAKPIINKKVLKHLKISEISKNHRYNHLNISDSPLYQLLISQQLPSTLSRNHYLEQSFARLLRDNNISIDQVGDLISNIDSIQNKTVQVDPEYLDDDKPFNPEMVNTYCFACKIPFIYPVLEDIPEVKEKIDPNWDEISYETMKKLMTGIIKPPDYIKLKALIRTMLDNDISRQILFFGLKFVYLKEWSYYKSIIISLINKSRIRKQ